MSPRKLDTNLDYASKWRGQRIRDTKTNEIGLVLGARTVDQQVMLVCRFPSRQSETLISLDKTPDLECLVPGYARARYRLA